VTIEQPSRTYCTHGCFFPGLYMVAHPPSSHNMQTFAAVRRGLVQHCYQVLWCQMGPRQCQQQPAAGCSMNPLCGAETQPARLGGKDSLK
jgi:hypothetical protein